MKRISVVVFVLVLSSHHLAAQRVTFGLYYPATFSSGNATVFQGYYDAGKFVGDTVLAHILEPYQPGQSVIGLNSSGLRVPFSVKRIVESEGDLGEGLLELVPEKPFLNHLQEESGPFLLMPKNVPLEVMRCVSAQLPSRIDQELRSAAKQLFDKALNARQQEETTPKLVLRSPKVQNVAAIPDLLLVSYPATVFWGVDQAGDETANVFFIYSLGKQRRLLSAFGHPDWAHVGEDLVLTVRPFVFFRIGTDPKVYFLGEHRLAWESNQFAIYDLESGRALITTSY